jgi:hypothetical protein
MSNAEAFYSDEHGCWFVPVSSELLNDEKLQVVEPARVELRDGQLWITLLEGSPR